MIDGVIITPLKTIPDERGAVMHMLRSDAPHFQSFGEVYFSIINPGVIKAWRRHFRMTMSLAVPKGRVKLILVDRRDDSPTIGQVQEIILGDDAAEYQLVTVPPMVWNGFQCISADAAIIANCASIPHDPDEVESLAYADAGLGYVW